MATGGDCAGPLQRSIIVRGAEGSVTHSLFVPDLVNNAEVGGAAGVVDLRFQGCWASLL